MNLCGKEVDPKEAAFIVREALKRSNKPTSDFKTPGDALVWYKNQMKHDPEELLP